ncbi:serine/threonine-protein phosphatase 4 regulatory subunit 4 isoform X2 [Orussus abietinus]|uniref:serine/threonine-protein phosphatase 4 regulatory subunit 4 isoform X2 n=1 Tax=Orussus abietinus TaxID=222816 RepID=UPI000C71616A|nr:serine/threonine-protein phosphatase 4 regulatory subunit 4 isoform X2 [Orussus abietinus]
MWQEEGEPPFESALDEKGDDIQKLSVIQTLPNLLATDAQSCITRVLPKVQQTLQFASTEFHVAASSTFKTILEQRLVSHTIFTQTFLHGILSSLDSRDPLVAHAWLETLLDVIELLSIDVIRQEILPIAINKGQLSQPISSRIMCCKLVGKICTRFDPAMIKKEVLPTVQSLCQDVSSEVRACICLQLRYVAEGLGTEHLKPLLLPSLVELASDEESIVRHASVQTIVHLLPQLHQETIKGIIIPLVRKLCESALKSDDNVVCVISEGFGKLALGLEESLQPPERAWFLRYYQQLAQMGIPSMKKENTKQDFPFVSNDPLVNETYVECRRQCAFNIPAMFVFVSGFVTPDELKSLLATFTDLAGDPYYMVRRTIACGIYEVAKVLRSRNAAIRAVLVRLLKDDSEEVLQGLVPHIAGTLELLVQSHSIGTGQMDSSVVELGRALLKCEAVIATTHNWRLSALMFEQLETLPKCFPSDFIYTYFVPTIVTRALNARPNPVRLAACRTYLTFLRYNLKTMQRTELRNRIYTDFARSQNCYVRMLFIRMMIEAMVIFSSIYFREYFYTTLLSLTEDPVANVRLKVATLLPTLKSILQLPTDKKLLATLEASVRNLMNNEKDRDVIAALTSAIHKMDGIDIKYERQSTQTKVHKLDSEDLRKYEEEKLLAGMVPKRSNMVPLMSGTGKVGRKQQTQKMDGQGRISSGEIHTSNGGKQSEPLSMETVSRSMSQQPLTRGRPSSMSDSMKSATSRPSDVSKASTSSDNLTSSWARLTSNSTLLTHPWERLGRSASNVSLSSVNPAGSSCNQYDLQKPQCNCYELVGRLVQTRLAMSNPSEQDYKTKVSRCPCFNADVDCPRTSGQSSQKHDYPSPDLTKSFVLTQLKGEKQEFLQNFLLTRESFDSKDKGPDLAALRALTNAAHYNSCWAFSSMPEIPVTLLDDEFLVDAGIRIPSQLSTSQSTSKIPNLQDIIYRNRREGSADRSRRSSAVFDKGKTKRHSSEYEDCIKLRTTVIDPTKGDRNSVDFEDGLRQRSSKEDQLFGKSEARSKRYSAGVPPEKSRFGFETGQMKSADDKFRRNSMVLEKDKSKARNETQPRSVVDRSKRHSVIYNSTKFVDTKDVKPKFKRHSMEVVDFAPVDRVVRASRRYSTLDVNHNQGSSKIPLRNCISHSSSGSRTAPSTRASSPTRPVVHLSFDLDRKSLQSSARERFLSRFSSSDEEVDKLCQKIIHCQTAPPSRACSPRTRDSRLPVRLQRKKL